LKRFVASWVRGVTNVVTSQSFSVKVHGNVCLKISSVCEISFKNVDRTVSYSTWIDHQITVFT